ncbi:acetyltransferase [Streptomyces sp. Je 1-79]|uniref:acetyltransferase n=1 Tax=Streptomyces sp. Je 1-79 TaxID=2943847 RepID=UPI0021A4E82B|nr:acetyltransferase [Streptomyces sp. Je 1-79]MCT4352340.1 acetyltransferase [Streptomyces sp. Je 1-79]
MKLRGKSVALTLLLSTAGLIGLSTPAHAASSAKAESACGSGYRVIDGMPLSRDQTTYDWATVFLLYNGSTGKNCVVTVRDEPEFKVNMSAKVRVYGGSWIQDTDHYSSYAGPVYVSAAGKCVQFHGMSNGSEYTSPWGHCG